MFVTKIQTYFKSKDTSVPVRLELRPVVNGHPSSTDIIVSVVVLPPLSVQVPTTQTQAYYRNQLHLLLMNQYF